MILVLDTMDENGVEVTQVKNGDSIQYIYTETGE